MRAEFVERLAVAGLPRVEVASFVSPTRVPQMAGPEEVVAGIKRRDGVVYAGLVLNERGYDRLLAAQLDEVHFSFAASETFNRRNGEGIETGVDLDALIDVAVWLEELLGEELEGQVYGAGRFPPAARSL